MRLIKSRGRVRCPPASRTAPFAADPSRASASPRVSERSTRRLIGRGCARGPSLQGGREGQFGGTPTISVAGSSLGWPDPLELSLAAGVGVCVGGTRHPVPTGQAFTHPRFLWGVSALTWAWCSQRRHSAPPWRVELLISAWGGRCGGGTRFLCGCNEQLLVRWLQTTRTPYHAVLGVARLSGLG